MNYYNEFDPKAAQWIRELIKEGVIPNGIVDERSIENVRADELRGFTQCHFFAGVGGWSFALRLAGIPDDFSCWTGSCPCQPFSNAGKREGVKDERDLWPVFFDLIKECKPQNVIGEQVSSSEVVGSELEASFLVAVQNGDFARANKIAKKLSTSKGFHFHKLWLDRIYSDMATEGYSMRFEVLGAHSVGANHIRQRLYWGSARVAQNSAGLGRRGRGNADSAGNNRQIQAPGLVHDGGLALPQSRGYGEREHRDKVGAESEVDSIRQEKGMRVSDSSNASVDGGLPDSDRQRCFGQSVSDERRQKMSETAGRCSSNLSPWSNFGLVLCRDTDKQGRHRVRRVPAESVLLGVADGLSEDLDRMRYQSICEHPERAFPLCAKEAVPGRAMLLKGFGNAINPYDGAAFITEFLTEVNK